MNVEQIFPKMRSIIADVLVLDESAIVLSSRLIGDLGAESIDFLDLVFQLEHEFKIKIPRGQLEKNARGGLSDEAFEQDGYVTDTGIRALRVYFSETPEKDFEARLKTSDIPTLFTVETFCKLVANAKASQSERTTAVDSIA